ncbi:MAG: BolA/IbaG family iron-sulfur metabolism protein [Candidatus Arsenophonus melophagi]|nr:BolA/IbaG family iron-sulfur metabolism protein [Candidatus Arsenophonus melophagi]
MTIKRIHTMHQHIEEKLKDFFSPMYLLVKDESDQHHIPWDSESHFNIILVTEKFTLQRMVARHQAVYQLLRDELSNCIHALALHTYTPNEWHHCNQKVFPSPACHGKSIVESSLSKRESS